jgi:hypothetical protein
MLLASWVVDQLGLGLMWAVLFFVVAIHYAKKFGNANPEVKDAAKKAAASKAIHLIAWIFKK